MVQLGHFFKEASGNRPVGQIGQARVNLHQKYCQSAGRKHFMIPVTRWQFKVYAWLCFGSMLSRWAAALDCPRLVCYLRIHSLGFITSHLSNSKKMHLVDGLYILPVSYSYIYNIYTTIWLFSIAMENPNHKWRFSSLGKSSASMGHGFQFASIYIYTHYLYLSYSYIYTNSILSASYFLRRFGAKNEIPAMDIVIFFGWIRGVPSEKSTESDDFVR